MRSAVDYCYKIFFVQVFIVAKLCASESTYDQDNFHGNGSLDIDYASHHKKSVIGAIYFMTNDPRGNSIVATSIQRDGKLGFSKSFSTGELGGYRTHSDTMTSGGPDTLGSQNSLIVHDNVLFGVNAGSSSVSLFTINRRSPTKLKLVQTVSSGGHFPVALAFSTKLQMLCVLNGGSKNGVQCFSFSRESNGVPSITALPRVSRPLGLKIQNTSFYEAPSDLLFTPDSSQLLVAIKGKLKPRVAGILGSFHIRRNGIGKLVRNVPVGSLAPFGMSIVPGTGITSDPVIAFADNDGGGFGLARIQATGVVAASRMTLIPGQQTTCWTAFSRRSGHLFTTDTIINLVTESRLHIGSLSAQILNQYEIPGGPLDELSLSLPQADFLYILTPVYPGIHVMSLAKPGHAQLVQQYSPTLNSLQFPLNPGAVGLAAYLKK